MKSDRHHLIHLIMVNISGDKTWEYLELLAVMQSAECMSLLWYCQNV